MGPPDAKLTRPAPRREARTCRARWHTTCFPSCDAVHRSIPSRDGGARRVRPAPDDRQPADDPPARRARGDRAPAAHRERHEEPLLQPHHGGAEEALRGGERARLLVRHQGRRALPRQLVQPEGLSRRRFPHDSPSDPAAPPVGAAAGDDRADEAAARSRAATGPTGSGKSTTSRR